MVSREVLAPAPLPVLASLLTVGTLLTLFILRPLDDNRLTSWYWVFSPTDGGRLALWVALAVLLAHVAGAIPMRGLRPGPLLVAAAFGVSALLWPTPEVILDAARHFGQAKSSGLQGPIVFLQAWGANIPAWTDLPLVPVLYGSLFGALGEERLYLQALNSFLFAGTALLTWQIGRTLWQEEVGVTAAALLLGMPFLLVQVPLTLVDIPTMFFVTLATFATLVALRRGGPVRIACAAAAIALACFTKYSAWLMLTVLPVLAVVEARGRAPEAGRRAAAIGGAALLLVGPVLLSMSEVIGTQLALLREFQLPALVDGWSESIVSTFLFQSHPFIAFAAIAALWIAWRARDGRLAIVAWLPLLMLVLGVRRARYLLPMMPMLALTAAYGLQAIRRAALREHVVRCIVASSLAVVFCGFLPFLQRNSAVNLQTAGAYLDSLHADAIEVVALPQRAARVNPDIAVPLLDLHTGKQLVADAPLRPSPPELARLPLRFTWEYRHPPFYGDAGQAAGTRPVAVVSDGSAADLPLQLVERLARHRLARKFAMTENVFGYQTLVSVYLPEATHDH